MNINVNFGTDRVSIEIDNVSIKFTREEFAEFCNQLNEASKIINEN